jgi:radical SAM superfamily enzyme YgiQ (UPF0313 family)
MKVLLIFPEFPDTFWSFKHALRFVHKKSSLPPLGLLTVAAMLPPDWELRLVDLNVEKLSDRDLKWAEYAFISAMVVQRQSTHQVMRRCKQAGLKIVAGGPLFASEMDQFPEVDHFILNEAEETLPPFLADLEIGETRQVYATTKFADLQRTPVPLWRLAKLKKYATMAIQFSRGCPFNCDFCNITTLFGHKPRVKTTVQILAELDTLYQMGWRGNVFFVDDNLIGNKRYLKESLLPAIIEWRRGKSGMPFNTEVSINLSDDEQLMHLMFEAGFDTVFIGVETPNEESLAECGKNHNLRRDLVENIQRIQRSGLQVQGGFIIGFDHDSPGIFQRMTDFIQKTGIVTAMVGLLQAPPGTPLYERLRKQGRVTGSLTGDNVDGTTNIIPMMSLELLHNGYRAVMRYLYAPENYYARIKAFLHEYKPPKIRVPIDFSYVTAFFRSIVLLGIIGNERLHYWKLFVWTLFRCPRLFPLAITLAIYGFHFRQVVKSQV